MSDSDLRCYRLALRPDGHLPQMEMKHNKISQARLRFEKAERQVEKAERQIEKAERVVAKTCTSLYAKPALHAGLLSFAEHFPLVCYQACHEG